MWMNLDKRFNSMRMESRPHGIIYYHFMFTPMVVRYDILNYQGFVDRVHQFQQVGHYLRYFIFIIFHSIYLFFRQWNGKEHLNITSQTIMFRARNNTAPTSVCSEPCRVGQKVNDIHTTRLINSNL